MSAKGVRCAWAAAARTAVGGSARRTENIAEAVASRASSSAAASLAAVSCGATVVFVLDDVQARWGLRALFDPSACEDEAVVAMAVDASSRWRTTPTYLSPESACWASRISTRRTFCGTARRVAS